MYAQMNIFVPSPEPSPESSPGFITVAIALATDEHINFWDNRNLKA